MMENQYLKNPPAPREVKDPAAADAVAPASMKKAKGETCRIESVDILKLEEQIAATYPHYVYETQNNIIKDLKIAEDEEKRYSMKLTQLKQYGYENRHVDFIEFILEDRLR